MIWVAQGDAFSPEDEDKLKIPAPIHTLILDVPYEPMTWVNQIAHFKKMLDIAARVRPQNILFWGNWVVYPAQLLAALHWDFYPRRQFVWAADYREGVDRPIKSELIGHYQKGPVDHMETYLLHGRLKDQTDRDHPEEKPTAIIEDILRIVGVESLYDPFAGSGNALKACQTLNIPAYGMEKDPEYFKRLKERFS